MDGRGAVRAYHPPQDVAGSTLLRELLRRRCLHHYREFCRAYDLAAAPIDTTLVGSYPAEPQFYRWIIGETAVLPHPGQCTVLEAMFPGYSTRQLFQITEPAGAETTELASPDEPDQTTRDDRPKMSGTAGLILPDEVPVWVTVIGRRFSDPGAGSLGRHNGVVTARGTARTGTEGQVIAMSAQRARDFSPGSRRPMSGPKHSTSSSTIFAT